MNLRTLLSPRGILFLAYLVVSAFFFLFINHQTHNGMLAASSFKPDMDRGFVAPIPSSYATFMGLEMFLVSERDFSDKTAPSEDELVRANIALAALQKCIRDAERRLLEYAGDEMISSSSDIQNPHVWLDPEAGNDSRWVIVVEAKDNDGYAWHIEFDAASFHDIWAGS